MNIEEQGVNVYVKATYIEHFLGIAYEPRLRLEKKGHLPARTEQGYPLDGVNAFLARNAHNFLRPLVWQDIESGRVVLLKDDEAAERFRLDRKLLANMRRNAAVPYLSLPDAPRTSMAGIAQQVALLVPCLSLPEAEKILGIDRYTLKHYVQSGALCAAPNPRWETRIVYVTQESLQQLLRTRLPSWIDPVDWIEDCQASEHPLVNAPRVAHLLGLPVKRIVRDLERRRALFVRCGPNLSKAMVSPIWIEAQYENDRPFEAKHVMQLFDVTRRAAWNWQQAGLLRCVIPNHGYCQGYEYLWRSCWYARLRASCSPRYEQAMSRFMHARFRPDADPLWNISQVKRFCGCSRQSVIAFAESGRLPGVRTPTGEWRFTRDRVYAIRARERLN